VGELNEATVIGVFFMPRFLKTNFATGDRKDPSDERDLLYKAHPEMAPTDIKMASALPAAVDHTLKMSPVKYQGTLGSCVSFAAAAMKEWQERREHETEVADGKPDRREEDHWNLSEQWIYWNCKKIDPWPNEEGTNIRSAMKVLQKIGVPTEQAWPYTDDPVNIGKPESWAHLIARWATIGSYWRVKDLSELKRALVEGPVIIGVALFEEFWDVPATLGFVPYPMHPKDIYGFHTICAVGYDDERRLVKFKNSWSCYDNQTEVLTDAGFKLFKNLLPTDQLATLNPDGVIEYHVPNRSISYHYSGDMFVFANSKIDLVVTPNHNMYIESLGARQKGKDDFRLVTAEEIRNKYIVFKRDGRWHDNDEDFFCLPSITSKTNAHGTKEVAERSIPMDLWLELLGYWISEGSIATLKCRRGGRQYKIIISQKKKRIAEKIKLCLNKLGIKFSYDGKNFYWDDEQMYRYLETLGHSYDKHIPMYAKKSSRRQLRILFDALMDGDGSITEGKNGSKKLAYYTSSKQLCDDFQEICLKMGLCTTVTIDDRVGQVREVKESERTENCYSGGIVVCQKIVHTGTRTFRYNYVNYRINIQNSQGFDLAKTILKWDRETSHYDDMVYCVDVQNHVIFVRRNGKGCWCGNCFWGTKGYSYFPYSYIDAFMDDAWAARDIQVTPEMLKGTRNLFNAPSPPEEEK
jgi:hypothetical protein